MKKIKRFFGGEREPSLMGDFEESMDELNEACTLTLQQRAIGFCVCVALGLVITFMSTIFIFSILTHPGRFALLYTVGNIIMLMSTGFLIGPCRQIRSMFACTRISASLIFLGAMAFTLFAAFKLHIGLLCILGVIIQFLALIWYTASYIPGARFMIGKCCKGCATSLCSDL